MKVKQRIKLFVILAVEFLAIAIMLVLIFFAGKKVYTVTFDLNGGTLLGGDPVQKVTQGQNATPPQVTKEGCYFLKWSGSYREVTKDVVIEAIWEYETSYGIEYNSPKDSNYCTISGCFDDLQGDIYIGAYHGDKKVLAIEPNAFAGCEGITRIHLLDGILTIGENAFAGCTNLESIELPDTAFQMADSVFADCKALEEVVLPEGLKTLGNNAFANCISLTSVTFSEGLESIGDNAFAGCVNLQNIQLPTTVAQMGEGVFAECIALEKMVLPEALKALGNDTFKNCIALTSVTLPEGLESIGENAFAGCTELKNIILPHSLLEIGVGAFDQQDLIICAYIKELEKPEGWADGWNAGDATVTWEYDPLALDTENSSSDQQIEN